MVGRSSGFRGYWANHKLIKPSVFTDINSWIGWEKLQAKVGQIEKKRNRNIVRAIFETGGRVSEVIRLKPEHFRIEEDKIRVVGAPLEKNKRFDKRWPFLIEKTEPLMQPLLDWINESDEWLFPSPLGKDPFLSRQSVWIFLNDELGLYPHWFRSMRAWCLSWEYGLTRSELMDWFTWRREKTAQHYARTNPDETAEKFHAYT